MRSNLIGLTLCVAVMFVAGCQEGQLMTVDFKLGQELEYKIVSERNVTLDVGSKGSKKGKSGSLIEKMELVISYNRMGMEDEYGRSLIKATCKSAKINRRDFKGKKESAGSVSKLVGKSFTLKISATGQVEDYSDLERVLQELGQHSLGRAREGVRVKKPDMIADFASSQWYLWDSVSKIKNPGKGAVIGKSWSTDQVVPMPMPEPVHVVKKATYTLSEIAEVDGEQIAYIGSVFAKGDGEVRHWADPYQEKYYIKGMFAFLKGYNLVSLDGSGQQVFNISKGLIEKETQEYKAVFNVAFPMALGDTVPTLSVDQKYTLELVNAN